MREKDRKVAIHCVFPMICGSGGSKSRLAKAAGAEPAGQMRDEKVHAVVARSTFPSQNGQNTRGADHFWRLRGRVAKKYTPLWHEAHFEVKMYKTHHVRTTFGRWDVEEVHAVVARSTFPSQNGQKAKRSGPLLEVEMSKKCTPLWREAHFEVKMLKTLGVRTTFGGSGVELRKSTRRCGAKHISKSKCTKHQRFGPLLNFGGSDVEFRKSARRCGAKHIWKLKC